jgi:hypothetical protein
VDHAIHVMFTAVELRGHACHQSTHGVSDNDGFLSIVFTEDLTNAHDADDFLRPLIRVIETIQDLLAGDLIGLQPVVADGVNAVAIAGQ